MSAEAAVTKKTLFNILLGELLLLKLEATIQHE